jgi:apolipoprotein D and lipocalin family protein
MSTGTHDLEAQIVHAEQAVIERDDRLLRQGNQVIARVSRGFKRYLGPGLLASAGAVLLAWMAPSRHVPSATGQVGRAAAHAVPWAMLVPVVWPLLPPTWRRRFSPATASALMGVAAPLLGALLPGRREVQTAPEVDLARYAGRWFEIARLPTPFERRCAGDATATYTPRAEFVEIDNRCRGYDGGERRALGIGVAVAGSHGAKWEVSLSPRWLRWLPFSWAGYWILQVDPQYQTAVAGTPGRKGLWLLARSPTIDDATFQRMVDCAAAQGYQVKRLKRVQHSA